MLLKIAALSTTFALALAPIQCASKPDARLAQEDEPGEALYRLAGDFHTQGNEASRVQTLQFLVKRYPNSRFAARAKDDLEGKGLSAHDDGRAD